MTDASAAAATTYTIEHFINGNRVLERLEIAEHFDIKVTDLQRLLKQITPRIYQAGNKYYYDLNDLTDQIAEYRARTAKKTKTADEVSAERIRKIKAVLLPENQK